MASRSPNIIAGTVIGMAILLISIVLIFFGDLENPVELTRARLNGLETAIRTYTDETGIAPKSLTELNLPAEALQDHLGEPIRYTNEDGVITLVSYGSDKKPGGFLFKRDHKVIFELPLSQ